MGQIHMLASPMVFIRLQRNAIATEYYLMQLFRCTVAQLTALQLPQTAEGISASLPHFNVFCYNIRTRQENRYTSCYQKAFKEPKK
jgi:hypothetical protein